MQGNALVAFQRSSTVYPVTRKTAQLQFAQLQIIPHAGKSMLVDPLSTRGKPIK